jgi:hypothetical protein
MWLILQLHTTKSNKLTVNSVLDAKLRSSLFSCKLYSIATQFSTITTFSSSSSPWTSELVPSTLKEHTSWCSSWATQYQWRSTCGNNGFNHSKEMQTSSTFRQLFSMLHLYYLWFRCFRPSVLRHINTKNRLLRYWNHQQRKKKSKKMRRKINERF